MLGAGGRLSGPCQLLCHTLCPVGAIWSLTSDIAEQAKGKCAEPVDDKKGSAAGGKWLRYGATGAVSKSGTVMELNVRNQPLNATYRQCVCVCEMCGGVCMRAPPSMPVFILKPSMYFWNMPWISRALMEKHAYTVHHTHTQTHTLWCTSWNGLATVRTHPHMHIGIWKLASHSCYDNVFYGGLRLKFPACLSRSVWLWRWKASPPLLTVSTAGLWGSSGGGASCSQLPGPRASQLGDTSAQPRGRELGGGSDRRAPVSCSMIMNSLTWKQWQSRVGLMCVLVCPRAKASIHPSMFVLTARFLAG